MEFKINELGETGVEVSFKNNVGNGVHETLNEEKLAEAVIFFWKALTMLNLFKDTKIAEHVAVTVTGPGKVAVDEASSKTRNIIIGKSMETDKVEAPPF